MDEWERVLGGAKFEVKDVRFERLWAKALSEFPRGVPAFRSIRKVQLRKRGMGKGLVGLTTYCCVEFEDGRTRSGRHQNGSQRITFYSELLDELSDSAAIGVIAHELAHAWLNEHVSPEASKEREREADVLAKRWGFGTHLNALAAETEPV